MSRDWQDLHPHIVPLFFCLLHDCRTKLGIRLYVTRTYRSVQEQNDRFAQGRTKEGKVVTRVKGGRSWHNVKDLDGPASLAFDATIRDIDGMPIWPDPDIEANGIIWTSIGEFADALGLTWGGRWKDPRDCGHFQYDAKGRVSIEEAMRGNYPPAPRL